MRLDEALGDEPKADPGSDDLGSGPELGSELVPTVEEALEPVMPSKPVTRPLRPVPLGPMPPRLPGKARR